MAEDLDKPLLDPDTFNRQGIDLVKIYVWFLLFFTLILQIHSGKKGFDA